jgi:polyisoprenyl-phosphate glycosyltransferase
MVKSNVQIQLSIVTPCFNEEDSIERCALEVQKIMKERMPGISYEHIFSDNASTDKTISILRHLAGTDKRIKVVVNSRNIGGPKNIYRALRKTKGLAIIPMLPADLQDPVEVIPELFSKWKLGNLVVYGKRINRQESLLMRALRKLYYLAIRKFATADLPTDVGDFLLIDKRVLENILALEEENPYIRGLVAQSGVRSDVVPYTWVKRTSGKSKMTPFVLIDVAINGLVSTSRLPARIALLVGFIMAGVGIAMGLFTLFDFLIFQTELAEGMPTIIIATFMLGGIQLFFLGLIGEYILSIHSQIRPEPEPFDLELINFK